MQPQQNPQKKILIIEDEQFIGELYTRALSRAGYEPTVANDGVKGLELAKSDQYDIILLDLMMPNMTGMDILSHLREEAPDLHGKIIVTTNLEQRDEKRDAIQQLADGYLIKANVTPRELVDFLQNVA
jgi:DNA-binding response OmpR family regulator